ncbi:hypothetical protein K466DRAFT_290011 [Polyporus arcularius HHB13444]|uniref:Uncharacterized protein n=1 Tax=Polyporus arcularius HHB13444 TaxID=1314778 RepID=A0A5C3P239_9APHY|nr:hypothetical protein K466DRAFT_290011 [Polyporus arcularius HHB13444]
MVGGVGATPSPTWRVAYPEAFCLECLPRQQVRYRSKVPTQLRISRITFTAQSGLLCICLWVTSTPQGAALTVRVNMAVRGASTIHRRSMQRRSHSVHSSEDLYQFCTPQS